MGKGEPSGLSVGVRPSGVEVGFGGSGTPAAPGSICTTGGMTGPGSAASAQLTAPAPAGTTSAAVNTASLVAHRMPPTFDPMREPDMSGR